MTLAEKLADVAALVLMLILFALIGVMLLGALPDPAHDRTDTLRTAPMAPVTLQP